MGPFYADGFVALDYTTSEDNLKIMSPNLVVEAGAELHLPCDCEATTTRAPLAPTMEDILVIPSITVKGKVAGASRTIPGGDFSPGNGFDTYMIMGDLHLQDSSFLYILDPERNGLPKTTLMVGGDLTADTDAFIQVRGEILSVAGGLYSEHGGRCLPWRSPQCSYTRWVIFMWGLTLTLRMSAKTAALIILIRVLLLPPAS